MPSTNSAVPRSAATMPSKLPSRGLARCGHCGALLTASFTLRQGQRHLYYVCRAGKKQQPMCPQQPVRARDFEQSLRERLEHRGTVSGLAFEQLIRAVSYHSGARRVSVELQAGNRLEFCLPVPVRPGVRRKEEKIQSCGCTPRLSRLMALASTSTVCFHKARSEATGSWPRPGM